MSKNIRINIRADSDLNDYLKTICNIYNEELENIKFCEIMKLSNSAKKKLNVSKLIYIAIGNLIINIDKNFDLKKSKEENHKAIFNFLSGIDVQK
jgi:hypothetical protein